MRKFRRSILGAAFIYFIDAFVFNQGGIALIVALVAVLVLFPKILVAFFKKNKELCRERIVRTGIYILMLTMVVVSNRLNNQLALRRAEELIQICNSYKSKYQKYPDKLEDLAPEFIPKVLPAKFTLAYNKFIYISREGRHLLVYYVLPPFGRRIYNLESGHWGYLD